MNTRPSVLWAAAAMASLALHGAIGMVLYAMPLPEPKRHGETEVTIKTLETQIPVQTPITSAISAAVSERPNASSVVGEPTASLELAANAARPVQPSEVASTALSSTTAPVETGIVLPGSSLDRVEVQPSPERMAAAVPDAEAIEPQPATTAVSQSGQPVPVAPTSDSVGTLPPNAEASIAAEGSASEAAAIVDDDAGLAAASDLAMAPAPLAGSIPGDAPLVTLGGAEAPAIADESRPVAALQPSLEARADTIAPVALDAIAPANGFVGPVPVAPSTSTATKTIPAAPTVGVAAAVAPGLLPVVPAPAATLSPAASPDAPGTELAMLPRPDTVGGPAPSAQGDSGKTPGLKRLPIAQFLVEEKDATDCLLALPNGIGLQQASIAAFSDAPEKVAKLGSEFERRSGLDLKADTYPVSRDQCGTLTFARDLAQYPNFPLRLTLSSPTIGSGQELAGTISGLRKDTLYLMVVDDEGKAELVRSYADLRDDTLTFHAPMTLTSGPVSSAQLLVAIATDGPLRTVATRPGMPADIYFERLKSEIIADQRSIAYGIAGFVVR